MTSNAKSLPVDRVHALKDLLDMYSRRDEDVLLCEAFANAVDVFLEDDIKNPKIEITLERTNSDVGYINFHNNGTPMTRKQFDKYHVIAGSYKKKGGGIGFAGVGAKVFLASFNDGEIFTITGKDNSDFMASRMFRTENDVKFEEIKNLSEIFPNNQFEHKYGTTYRVRVNLHRYKYFKERLQDVIRFWWNFSLLKKQFDVIVDGRKIGPFDPREKFRKSFAWKKHNIDCYCWISRNEIPPDIRHIVYTVHGKRIMNEVISQPIRLKENYFNRVFCLVDVSHLAKYIKPNKESFDGNWETNRTRQAAQKFFIQFLTEQGLVGRDILKQPTTEIVNEMTKELDRLLKTKEFQDLDPFLSPRKLMIPMPNKDGDIPISEVEGEGSISNNGGNGSDTEHEEGKSFVEDPDGDKPGKQVERKSKGIRIILTDEYPDEKEEAWVDLNRGAVCINVRHPFYVRMKESDEVGKFEKFNVNSLLIEALIKFKNNELKENWDPEKTLNTYRDLLHKIWSGR